MTTTSTAAATDHCEQHWVSGSFGHHHPCTARVKPYESHENGGFFVAIKLSHHSIATCHSCDVMETCELVTTQLMQLSVGAFS